MWLLLVSGFWFLASAHAASPTPPPVLVVDMKRVLDESTAAVNAQKQIEAKRSGFQVEIAAKEKSIRAAEQELLQQRGKLERAEYGEKENKLRTQFRDVEKYVMKRRRVLEAATTKSMGEVKAKLLAIVADSARAHGSAAVLIKQQVLWTEGSIDITDEVLKRLNAEMPDLKVDIKLEGEEEKDGKKPEKPGENRGSSSG